jgi:peptide chain release factor 3
MSQLDQEIARRRTFAIISHPDAGKTTLTEKLLLFGGAIQLAGAVKARGEQRRARSDWMQVERQRGISVTASVMTYEYRDWMFNLLDTPGHEDFSEDTYRVLTAVDSAVMVLDAAKGIETQTRKLFEVCRLRNIPIITFINKMDREGRDPFELLDEIEQTLALDVAPASWPIGRGRDFLGCYDLRKDQLLLMKRKHANVRAQGETLAGLSDPRLDELVGASAGHSLRDEVAMVRGLCPALDDQAYREGHMTPVFFGSALNSFGVMELMDGLAELAPPPRPQVAVDRTVEPNQDKVTGFVFKIQANMDQRHRDRIAFMRLCSGQFRRGMKLTLTRTGKAFTVNNAVLFQARDRELAEEAWPGDIVGIPNHGTLHIGDTLTEGEPLRFTGVPSFAPELLRKVRPDDPMRAKHLGRALHQLAEEGTAQAFKRHLGSEWVLGVVGALQFEVLAERIKAEYSLEVHYESCPFVTARWIEADDPHALKKYIDTIAGNLAEDHTGALVYLARSTWQLEHALDDVSGIRFARTKETGAT